MIGIIDYNAGNIPSVMRALNAINCEYIVGKTPDVLKNVDRLIFPGVGDAEYAMTQLKITGFDLFLKEQSRKKIPILGICLGSQIIFDYSEEGNVECLGLLSGKIRHFSEIKKQFPLKVPHMGWNDLNLTSFEQESPCGLLKDVPAKTSFYFVHSFVICPQDNSVVRAYADYEIQVPSVICKDNIYALQFHPEKSGEPGLQILRNFSKI